MRSEEPVQVVLPQEPVPPGVFSRWSCVGDLENLATNPDTLRTCIFHNVCHEHGDWLYYERQELRTPYGLGGRERDGSTARPRANEAGT